jgi:hypothetical protein
VPRPGPRRCRAQWPGYRPTQSGLSTPDVNKSSHAVQRIADTPKTLVFKGFPHTPPCALHSVAIEFRAALRKKLRKKFCACRCETPPPGGPDGSPRETQIPRSTAPGTLRRFTPTAPPAATALTTTARISIVARCYRAPSKVSYGGMHSGSETCLFCCPAVQIIASLPSLRIRKGDSGPRAPTCGSRNGFK